LTCARCVRGRASPGGGASGGIGQWFPSGRLSRPRGRPAAARIGPDCTGFAVAITLDMITSCTVKILLLRRTILFYLIYFSFFDQ
jgi:hypothetical protein